MSIGKVNKKRVSFFDRGKNVDLFGFRKSRSKLATFINVNNEFLTKSRKEFQPTLYMNNANPYESEALDISQPEATVPFSRVSMTSNKGKRYQMTFRAKDPEFYFPYVHRRKSPESFIHKGSQACSTDYFVEVRDLRSQKFVMRMKRYRIAPCLQVGDGETSDQTSPLSKVNSKPKKNKGKEISNEIYVEKDGMLFLITAEAMEVEIGQTMHDEGVTSGDNLSGTPVDVRKGAYNAEPNRASLVVRVQKDVMRVRFILDELEVKPISVYVSRGAQCSERYAYVKFCPVSLNKVAYCAVPLSTYCYRDPMIAIRRKNYALRKLGQDPAWLVEERRKRIEKSTAGSGGAQEGQDNSRSVIVFELNGLRVKLRYGLMGATLLSGADIYDDFVIANKTDPRLTLRSVSCE
ncbi:hypothetical protein FBUS_04007 [Fasciolopsis buskii]|uniref:Uncharacterized protein n=1 Tax=Fasciolopsis buskii TaxID=27845 RepID=A0A8E0RVH5_9TREM|nr:hypothetical protein FBUS_04007 [Fasciolopsis buski]